MIETDIINNSTSKTQHKFFWNQIEENLFIIAQEGLEDFRAVFGAKTSRSISVENRWNINYDQVQNFLLQNLMQYGHASIGDMSFISVFHRGFGWLTAWLLEDDPLFNGQEVSSRAVNVMKSFPDMCYDAFDKEMHERWSNIYLSIPVEGVEAYKYDHCRWALPGSVQTGVTVMMTARTFIRHMEKIKNISFASETANKYLLGAMHCAKALFTSLSGKSREPSARWQLFVEKTKTDNCITITAPHDIHSKVQDLNMQKFASRKDRNTYIPDELNQLGLFKVEIICSIAAARDWHRHRAVMPWSMSLVTKNGLPFISSFYNTDTSIYKDDIDKLLVKGMQHIDTQQTLQSLYCLPFGACVKLTCYASINYLLYMLELRAFASGSNKEYANIALDGLSQIRKIMPKDFCDYFSICAS